MCLHHSVDYRYLVAESFLAGVPAYFYPWPASKWWRQFADMRPGTVVIVNPASGPGNATDPRYASAIDDARNRGLIVLGYVDTDYGAVDVGSLVDQSSRYHAWYEISGIFLDRVAPDDSSLPQYGEVAQHLHDIGLSVAFNAGQPYVDPGYAAVADHLVMFEGPLSSYVECQFPKWTQEVAPKRIWHLVYGVATAEEMTVVVARATASNAGLLYVTDGIQPNPWDHLPPYWDRERQLLDAVSSGG
jgi:hypothetical protein